MSSQDRVKQIVTSADVVLFMKGNRMFPQCGFSARAIEVLRAAGAGQFQTVDVLADPDIRQGVKEFSNWPTIPQLYVRGEFVGGSDIMMELYQSGELQKMLAPPST